MNHMPRIKVDDGSHKVETEGCRESDDNDTRVGSEEVLDKAAYAIRLEFVPTIRVRECRDDEVEGEDDNVELDQAENNEGDKISVT